MNENLRASSSPEGLAYSQKLGNRPVAWLFPATGVFTAIKLAIPATIDPVSGFALRVSQISCSFSHSLSGIAD